MGWRRLKSNVIERLEIYFEFRVDEDQSPSFLWYIVQLYGAIGDAMRQLWLLTEIKARRRLVSHLFQ